MEIRDEIFNGLLVENKYIPSKFFYDDKGSDLFEKITHLNEYYPTSTEMSILRNVMPSIAGNLRNVDIVELGSGDCTKISMVLNSISDEAIETVCYVPVDVSSGAIEKSAKILLERYPNLRIDGLLADFYEHIEHIPDGNQRFICFFGSTIGNMTRMRADRFLNEIGKIMRPGDRFYLGLDMVKDISVLKHAYNDNGGITAEFNLNIMNVVNKLAGTNFDIDDFTHRANWNHEMERIEMYLIAKRDMKIESDFIHQPIEIESGEPIHTENSHKFTKEHINHFEEVAGLSITAVYFDKLQWFSLVEFTC